MPFDDDGFDFGFLRANEVDDDSREWRDIPMFGVPDMNNDGKHDVEDLTILTTMRVLEDHAREVALEQIAVHVTEEYDAASNTVTVTATDGDGHQAVGTYTFSDGGVPNIA